MSLRRVKYRLLSDIREGLKASVAFFALKNKPDRELWDCREFVLNLNLLAKDEEFVAQKDDPPDVVFRGARFESKEILDLGRRRHQEYRDALKRAEQATDPTELLRHHTPVDLSPAEIGDLVGRKLADLRNKYEPTLMCTLDLLFYVNLKNHHLKVGPMPSDSRFAGFGWRSVSAFIGWGALVFYAAPNAPEFIRSAAGRVTVRKFK
jgi:hypothetical protein